MTIEFKTGPITTAHYNLPGVACERTTMQEAQLEYHDAGGPAGQRNIKFDRMLIPPNFGEQKMAQRGGETRLGDSPHGTSNLPRPTGVGSAVCQFNVSFGLARTITPSGCRKSKID